jgi:hypothetical protein
VVIPERSDQIAYRTSRGSRGGRPPRFDAELYRDRDVVERAFNRLKGWRGIATRYDKHARNYRAVVILACIVQFWTPAAPQNCDLTPTQTRRRVWATRANASCGYCQPALRAASSIAASRLSKVVLSILSITGPVSRPSGPPFGTYR